MKFWLDTEFWERPGSIQLISIGIVSEDGRELYLENADFIWGDCDSVWLHENVRPHMRGGSTEVSYDDMAAAILEFVGPEKPEFWAYYADYDWVVFCWIFGAMVDLPPGWPMFCLDVKQWSYMRGNIRLPDNTDVEHHALNDARWTKRAWQFLMDLT